MSELPIAQALRPFDVPETAPSLWRRVLDTFAARRRRQADRLILRSLSYHGPRLDSDFRVELERRLMGQ